MPRRVAEDDWDEDGESDSWSYDEDDFSDSIDEGEDEATVSCPYCKSEIPEDTPRCPYCEQYISEEDAPPTAKPWWIIVGALLCLFVVFLWVIR